jgi:hypothetical protein
MLSESSTHQRPFIDSIERAALPASGMKIFTPKLGTQASVALTAEGAEFCII